MGTPPKVGLIVYGFDDDQKNGNIGKPLLQRLKASVDPGLFIALGSAMNVKL
jgi:hypothetical protein